MRSLTLGKLFCKENFTLTKKDNVTSLKRKTQRLEHKSYPEAVIKIFRK